jgi:hypothetical protein
MAEPMAIDTDTNRMEPDVIDPLDTDPLDWTVDQVVVVLCDSPSTWSADPSLRPDPVDFKGALRKESVTGKVLLGYVGKALLDHPDKEILGLNMGLRSTLLDVIKQLQKKSIKYQNSEAPNKGKLLSFIPYSKH